VARSGFAGQETSDNRVFPTLGSMKAVWRVGNTQDVIGNANFGEYFFSMGFSLSEKVLRRGGTNEKTYYASDFRLTAIRMFS